MNFESVEKIATAVLYEGYILYPYRKTAIKNRQRWNFGTLYPRVYAEQQRPQEPFRFVAEFLCVAPLNSPASTVDAATTIDVRISFLQQVRQRDIHGTNDLSDPSLAWDEALERTYTHRDLKLHDLLSARLELALHLDGMVLPEGRGSVPAPDLEAHLIISAKSLDDGSCRLHIELQNTTHLPSGSDARRDEAFQRSFVSAHVVLGISNGEFISLLEPPSAYSASVAACNNAGVFPVLAGEEPDRSLIFCSPIILYDYPKIAPESEGDFFDGTEMDEMLALRVLTLTDAEKGEMLHGDPRARRILERTEAMTEEAMLKAHGVIRSLRRLSPEMIRPEAIAGEQRFGAWNPFEEPKVPPESVSVFGVDLRVGDRIRLWPQKSADIMDMALKGKVAVIEAIEQDFEDQVQFAVVLDDDPGREFGMMRQPGHRFFFSPEEVEPVGSGGPA
jgi:hypothetical protein